MTRSLLWDVIVLLLGSLGLGVVVACVILEIKQRREHPDWVEDWRSTE